MSTTHDSIEHRRVHEADPDAVSLRDVDAEPEGTMRLRMPVSSTGEARDGDAFSDERLRGFAEQLREKRIPLFLDHGRGGPGETRYGQLRKVGYWDQPAIEERDGASELMADAVLVDPDILDAEVGEVRGALAWLRAQAEAGLPIASSVGWSESTGDRELPGGADLLEISIVGIPSDPRTTTSRRAEYDVGDETVTIEPPEAVVNAATLALARDDELNTDCGTGVGDQRAQQIAGDEVGPDVIDEVAAYLTSHEADVTADGPPTDWSEEEWSDCGNLQYAKWGGLGTGTGLDWAQDRANAVAEALGEELPYPNRQMTDTHNLDDPEFAEGDAVRWSSQDTPVHGRVAEVGDEFEPAEGVTITGDDGEAVYLIHEYDDSLSPPQFRRANVAKPESSLSESGLDMPPASDDNFADSENSMTDTDTSENDTDDATDGQHREMMEEMMERLVDMQEQQMEMMEEMVDREGPKDDEDEDEDDDEDDGEMSESDADTAASEERTVTLSGTEQPVDEAIATLREEYDAAEVTDLDAETADRAEGEESDPADDVTDTFGLEALR